MDKLHVAAAEPGDRTTGSAGRVLSWTMLAGLLLAFIIGPFLLFEAAMTDATVDALTGTTERAVTAATVVAALVADVVLPIPSSLVAVAAGGLLGFPAALAACAAGMVGGGLAGFAIGRFGRGWALRLLDPAQAAWLRTAMQRHGPWIVAAARPLPVLAEASVIVAGLSGMELRRFLAPCLLSSLGVSAVYAAAGAFAAGTASVPAAFFAAIALPGLFWAVSRIVTGRMRT